MKEMRVVDGVETEVEVDDSGEIIADKDPSSAGKTGVDDSNNDNPDKTPKDDELKDHRGVAWKNVAKENERKYSDAIKRIDALEKEKTNPPVQKVDRIENYRKSLESKGVYTQEEINDKIEQLKIIIDTTNESFASKLKDVSQPLQTVRETINHSQRKSILDQFENDSEIGELVKKNRKDIDEELRTIPLEYDLTPDQMETVIGKVLLKKRAFIQQAKTTKKIKDSDLPIDNNTPGSAGKGGINGEEFEIFVLEHGLDVSTPDLKKSAINAYNKRKDYLKRFEK